MTIRHAAMEDLKAVTELEAKCFPAAEAAGRAAFFPFSLVTLYPQLPCASALPHIPFPALRGPSPHQRVRRDCFRFTGSSATGMRACPDRNTEALCGMKCV